MPGSDHILAVSSRTEAQLNLEWTSLRVGLGVGLFRSLNTSSLLNLALIEKQLGRILLANILFLIVT